MFRPTIIALLTACALAATDKKYVYDTNGKDWGEDFPECKDGKEQSPINLFTDGAERSNSMQIDGYGYRDYSVAAKDT